MPPQKKVIKNRPKNEAEKINDTITPFTEGVSKPAIHEYKRGNDTSRRDDDVRGIHIGIADIDQAVLYYFQEVIKPYTITEGTVRTVPVIYANPERWKSAQRDGYFRDKEGRVLLPVIAVKRDRMDRNKDISQKLDGNRANLYQVYERKYTRKNQYDNFSVLTNRGPVKEFYNIVMPDYYTMTYSCAVYTSFMEDMNKILEGIAYRSDSYWGAPGRFQFKARIDSLPITNEIVDGDDRRISSLFSLTINGYITPDNVDKQITTDALRSRNKTKIVFTLEASGEDIMKIQTSNNKKPIGASFAQVPDSITIINGASSDINQELATYLSRNVEKRAAVVTTSSATFTNTNVIQPPAGSGLPPTSMYDFKFFANGLFIPYQHIVSFTQSVNDMVLTVNVTTLEYEFESDWEITAIGKFQ